MARLIIKRASEFNKQRCATQSCGKIIKDCMMVEANIGSGYYSQYFHLDCFKIEHWGFIHALYKNLTKTEKKKLRNKNP